MSQQNANPQNLRLSPAEEYRQAIFKAKKDELDKELQKIDWLCVQSRDLETLLRLHNFMLKESFRDIKKLYDTYLTGIENTLDEKELIEILKDTFNLIFVRDAIDFYNEIGVRAVVSKNVNDENDKVLMNLYVIYKGSEKDELFISSEVLEEVIQEINTEGLKEDLRSQILKNDLFMAILAEALITILINHNIKHNTLHFTDSKNLLNATDFADKVKNGHFKTLLSNLEDVFVETQLKQ